MPIVRLPLLQGEISAENLLKAYQESKMSVAVVNAGDGYHMIMLDASRISTTRGFEVGESSFNFVGTMLAGDDFAAVGGNWIDVAVDSHFMGLLAAPQYACPKNDYSSRKPGTCPFHGDTLKPVKKGK